MSQQHFDEHDDHDQDHHHDHDHEGGLKGWLLDLFRPHEHGHPVVDRVYAGAPPAQ